MGKRNVSTKGLIVFFTLFVFAVSLAAGVVAEGVTVYHGNTKSKVFHKPSCRYYNCKHCTVEFLERQEAIDSGYRPCKICKP